MKVFRSGLLLSLAAICLSATSCNNLSDNPTTDQVASGCSGNGIYTSAQPFQHELRHALPGGFLDSPATNSLLDGVADPIRSAYHFPPGQPKIYVVPASTFDAHAQIENDIFISVGAIKSSGSSEDLEGVLSHEMAHIACHHASRNKMFGVLDYATTVGSAALILGAGDWARNLTKNAQAFIVLGTVDVSRKSRAAEWAYASAGWSRNQETAADLVGTETLVQAKQSTTGLVDALTQAPEMKSVPDESALTGSDHPSPAKRIDTINAYMAKNHPNYTDPKPDPTAYSEWTATMKGPLESLAYLLQAQDAIGKPVALAGHPEAVKEPWRTTLAITDIRQAFHIPLWQPSEALPEQDDPEMNALANLGLTKWLVAEIRVRAAPGSVSPNGLRQEIFNLPDLPQSFRSLSEAGYLHDGMYQQALDVDKAMFATYGDQDELYPGTILANTAGPSKPRDPMLELTMETKCLATLDANLMAECKYLKNAPPGPIAMVTSQQFIIPPMVDMPKPVEATPAAQPTRHRRKQ